MALAASAAFTLTGCGGGGGGGDDKAGDKPSASATASKKAGAGSTGNDTPSATPTQVLAQIKGEKDMVLTINSAVRDSGGFVTVSGVVTNNGTSGFTANLWVGSETALSHSGASVAGAVLVDEAGKKRYYVLRDTDGRCLCTMGLVGIQPKESRPFFAQFPAPPTATTQVDFELPTMPPAKITISEG
ncbi:hypothetical protein ABZ901_13415 [Actinacidiphila alni]|uniref:hypothetical protein n=1 Tax=Actinacidiphila alni TaxID=380248 RepID=UPI0033D836A9